MAAEKILSKRRILETVFAFLGLRDVGSCMNTCIHLCNTLNTSVDLWEILGRRKALEEKCEEMKKFLLPEVLDAKKNYDAALEALCSIKVPEVNDIVAIANISDAVIPVQKLVRVIVALTNVKAPREWTLIVELMRDTQHFVHSLSDHVDRCKQGFEVRLFVTVDKLLKVMKSSSMNIDNFRDLNTSCIPLHNFVTTLMSYESAKAQMRSNVVSWKALCQHDVVDNSRSKQKFATKVPTFRNTTKASFSSKQGKQVPQVKSSLKLSPSPKSIRNTHPKVSKSKHTTMESNLRRPSAVLGSPSTSNEPTGKTIRSNSVPGISSPSVQTMLPSVPSVSPSLPRKPAAGGMAALRLELADSKKVIARYVRELEEASNRAIETEQKAAAQSEQISHLLETELKLVEDLKVMDTNVTNLTATLLDARNSLAQKVEELDAARSNLTSLSVKLEISEQHNLQLTEQLSQSNLRVESQELAIKGLEEQLHSMKASMEADVMKRLMMERKRFEDTLALKAKQIVQIGHEHAYIIEAKDKKIEQVEKEKMIYAENVTQAERRVQLAMQEKQKLSLEVKDHLDTIRTLREEISTLTKEKEMYEKGDYFKTHCIGLPSPHHIEQFEHRPEKDNHHDSEKHYNKEGYHQSHAPSPEDLLMNQLVLTEPNNSASNA